MGRKINTASVVLAAAGAAALLDRFTGIEIVKPVADFYSQHPVGARLATAAGLDLVGCIASQNVRKANAYVVTGFGRSVRGLYRNASKHPVAWGIGFASTIAAGALALGIVNERNYKSSLDIVVDNVTAIMQLQQDQIDGIKLKTGPQGTQGLVGPQGTQGPVGPQGKSGDNYVLTEKDKTDIAGIVGKIYSITPTPTPTAVPTPTATAVPTPTATAVPTPTATAVPIPAPILQPTPTPTPAQPKKFPYLVPTQAPIPTPTAIPTPTPAPYVPPQRFTISYDVFKSYVNANVKRVSEKSGIGVQTLVDLVNGVTAPIVRNGKNTYDPELVKIMVDMAATVKDPDTGKETKMPVATYEFMLGGVTKYTTRPAAKLVGHLVETTPSEKRANVFVPVK